MNSAEQQLPDIPPDPGRRRLRSRNIGLSLNQNLNTQFVPIATSVPDTSGASTSSSQQHSNSTPSIPIPNDTNVPNVPLASSSLTVDAAESPPVNNNHNNNNQPTTSQQPRNSPSAAGVRDFRVLIEPLSLLNQTVSNNSDTVNHPSAFSIVERNSDQQQMQPEENNVENMDPEVVVISVEEINPIYEIQNRVINNPGGPSNSMPADPTTPLGTGKKRKRSKGKTPLRTPTISNINDDDDDGTICPICLDNWEMSGTHRLTSLKCGHLFGDSCIRRWLAECPSGTKCCPSCKSRCHNRDLRYIYAKRIRAIDNTEEIRLKESLDNEKTKYTKLQTDYELMAYELKTVKSQVGKLQNDLERMRRITSFANNCSTTSSNSCNSGESNNIDKYKKFTYNHKMFLSKNIEISKEAGCRVMIYSRLSKNLMVSQKSSQSLFPGYGIKLIDVNCNFRPTTFLHTSLKPLRDLSMSMHEDVLVCASMEKSSKIFDINNRSVINTFTPSDKCIWACAMDRQQRSNFLYLGSQHGSTYIYDIRNPSTFIEETNVVGDQSPVINIAPVTISDLFPLGGFLVCKLQSLWFYEFLPSQSINATRLSVDGPFMSMNYDSESGNILISTRPSNKFPMSKYILGQIIKINDIVTLEVEMSLFGSKTTQVMSRCTQIPVKDNSLVAAYIQDAKQLTLWNVGESTKIQSLPCGDIVFDTCPVNGLDKTYVAALTEMKCRIYEVISTPKF